MNYKSPIELVMTQMRTAIEGETLKAVQNVGVIVDKEELLKALQYDREQYQKGYEDRDLEIVRCKDCKHRPKKPDWETYEDGGDIEFPDEKCPCQCSSDRYYSWYPDDDWFCAEGERRGSGNDN